MTEYTQGETHLSPVSPDNLTMVNLTRGFRRLTWCVSVLLGLPWLAMAFGGRASDVSWWLGFAVRGFALPWCVFFVAVWVARGFGAPDATRPTAQVETQTPQAPDDPPVQNTLRKYVQDKTNALKSVAADFRDRKSRTLPVSLAVPPALRTKATFEMDFEPSQIADALQLAPAERETFLRTETWPRMIQVDQWGEELFRWRLFVRGQAAAIEEWDTDLHDHFAFWDATLDPETGGNLVLDWAMGRLRLSTEHGRFEREPHYAPDGSIEHSTHVLLDVSFPFMTPADRRRHRDAEMEEFTDWDFVGLKSEMHGEFYCGGEAGIKWRVKLFDHRPTMHGEVIATKTLTRDYPYSEWRRDFPFVKEEDAYMKEESEDGPKYRQLLYQVECVNGERFWVPHFTITPDSSGNADPPIGSTVFITPVLQEDEVIVVRVRPWGREYADRPLGLGALRDAAGT